MVNLTKETCERISYAMRAERRISRNAKREIQR